MLLDANALTGNHLAAFALGYLLVLLTPGPNFIVLAGISLVRGFRGSVPICLGITLGSIGLAAGVAVAADLVPDGGAWDSAARATGGLLLLYVAWRLLSAGRLSPASTPAAGGDFALGFGTALFNPITGAYFAGHYLAVRGDWLLADHLAVLALAGGIALLRSLAVAAVIGGLALRVKNWRRGTQLAHTAGVVFALAALWLLASAVMSSGGVVGALGF
jgi:threonine/homoserine/homoserine lactone efflux protein